MANIETTQELNKLLKEQNKLLLAQAKIMKSQAASMKAMMTSMQKMPVEDVNRSFNEMNNAIKDADKALEDFGGEQNKAFTDAADGAQKAADEVETLTEKIKNTAAGGAIIATLTTAFQGLNAGTRAGIGIFQSLLSVAGTLTKSFFGLTASIIAIPFKMMSALMEEAASGSGTEFRQAIADLRKEMGSLATNEGQAVMKSFRNMRKEGVETGLSTYRVFGNMAERLKFVTEMAKSLGRTFTQFSDELAVNGSRLGSYQKGLGLSEEAMGMLGKNAAASGKTLIETGREITTMAYGMGEAFGINGKLISRDIVEMQGDFENFGSIGTKQMSSIAVFTRKLGIEVKDLLGLIGKFDDFEDAAQSAAQLSQAFGMQVDTLEMLKEQDPAARFEKMRKAFHATGKSVENLNRQELSLLSSQSGISAEALKIGFAQGKQNMSYAEVQKQSEKTEKKQLSQAEAMEKLSDSIELMVKSGAQMQGGFFDIFIQGFERGIRISGPFRVMLRSLRRAMRSVRMAGVQVGRMFVDTFPGVKDIMDGLTESFKNFGRFTRKSDLTKFLGKVVDDFRMFFKMMSTDPKTALKTLFASLKEDFFDKLKEDEAPGKKILNGIKKFFISMGGLLSTGIEMAMMGATEGFSILTDVLEDPSALFGSLSGAQSGIAKFFVDVLGPSWKAIEAQWPKLKVAMVGLWEQAVISLKLKERFEKFKDMVISGITRMAIGSALSRLLISGTMVAFAAVASSVNKKGASMLSAALGKSFTKAGTDPKVAAGIKSLGDAAGASGPAAVKSSMSARLMRGAKFGVKAAGFLVAGIAALGLIAYAIAKSYPIIRDALGDIKPGEVAKVGMAMGVMMGVYAATALVIVGAAGIGVLMGSTLGVGAVAIGIGIASIALIATGMVAHTITLVKEINKMPAPAGLTRKVGIFTAVLGAMTGLGQVLNDMMSNSSSMFLNIRAMWTGGNPMVDGIEALGGIMSGMAKHMTGIISQIATITRGISPEQIKAGEMIGTLLEALGSFMQALIPPPELTGSFLDKAVGVDTLGAVNSYMVNVIHTIKDRILPMMTDAMQAISKMPDVDPKKVGIFSGFMKGIAALLQALQPPAGLTEMLTESDSQNFWREMVPWADKQEESQSGAGRVSAIMDKMIKSMLGKDGVLTKVQGFMKTLVKSMGNADPAKISATAEVFSSVMSALSQVSEMFSPKKMKSFNEAGGMSTTSVMLSELMSQVITPMAEEMPNVISEFNRLGTIVTADAAEEVRSVVGRVDDMMVAAESLSAKMAERSGAPMFSNYFGMLSADIATVQQMFKGEISTGIKDMVAEINTVTSGLANLKVPAIKTQLKQTADKLGLAGSEEFKIKLNDINLTIEVGVVLDADEFEKALINRPGKSKFLIKGTT